MLVTTILVGCSKKEESFANDAALETESAELSKAIQENIAENPKQLLSPQQSPLEKSRQLVKTSQQLQDPNVRRQRTFANDER